MKLLNKPWIRLILLLILAASLFYLPTREFLKITGMLGIPAVFLAGFMHKQEKRSLKRRMAAVLLVAVAVAYIYLLVQLPERIEVRRIMASGSVLVQQGQYDRAMAQYRKLEKLGEADKMQAKIEDVEKEKKAQRDLELVKQMVKDGDYDEARKIIKTIPRKTRAAGEAARLLESIDE